MSVEVAEEKCKTCGHYGLYKMITSESAWGGSMDIPCFRCIHYINNDEFVAIRELLNESH